MYADKIELRRVYVRGRRRSGSYLRGAGSETRKRDARGTEVCVCARGPVYTLSLMDGMV